MVNATKTNKKGVEAWWGFLGGAVIVIIVVILFLFLYGQIKGGSENILSGLTKKIGDMFK